MNDKTKTVPAATIEPAAKLFAVTKAFWLGDKPCAAGEQVQLTESQAKRLDGAVKLV